MAEMVFDEAYGTLTRAQRAAYRKHGISPSDHDLLVVQFGEENRSVITAAVKAGWSMVDPVDPRTA